MSEAQSAPAAAAAAAPAEAPAPAPAAEAAENNEGDAPVGQMVQPEEMPLAVVVTGIPVAEQV